MANKRMLYRVWLKFRCHVFLVLLVAVTAFQTGCKDTTQEAQPSLDNDKELSTEMVLDCTVMVLDARHIPIGCGFFIQDTSDSGSTNHYFVTAAHIFYGIAKPGDIHVLKLRHRVGKSNYNFQIPTTGSEGLLFSTYQTPEVRADIVVVRIENIQELQKLAPCLKSFTTNLSAEKTSESSLSLGDAVEMGGLLTPISTAKLEDKGEVLLRKSSIAAVPLSLIELQAHQSNLIILDGQSWPSCSGAPVFAARSQSAVFPGRELIGLITGYVTRDYLQGGVEIHEKLPLTYVTPIKYVQFAISKLNQTNSTNTADVFTFQ